MPNTFMQISAATARICCIRDSDLKAVRTRLYIRVPVVISCFETVDGRLCCEYGELLTGLREVDDSLLDHDGLSEFRSGFGDGDGEIGRANAFAVEL